VLFALGHPVALIGLLLAFLLGLVLRAFAIRISARSLKLSHARDSVTPRLREDIDPFGAVAAAIGGTGWGKVLDVDEVPRFAGRGRAALVFASGPISAVVASQVVFLAYALLFPSTSLVGVGVTDVLLGRLGGPMLPLVLLSLAVGLLAFGLLALIPIPPLDGFGILWSAMRRPGPGMQGYRLWFETKNIGVLVLLVCCFFPLGNPILLWPLDLIGTVFIRLWG
jgi:hypothetical protein